MNSSSRPSSNSPQLCYSVISVPKVKTKKYIKFFRLLLPQIVISQIQIPSSLCFLQNSFLHGKYAILAAVPRTGTAHEHVHCSESSLGQIAEIAVDFLIRT